MDFKKKYFKYKSKYLNLKNQRGGAMTWKQLTNIWETGDSVFDLTNLLDNENKKIWDNSDNGLSLKFHPFNSLEDHVKLTILKLDGMPEEQNSKRFDEYLKVSNEDIVSFMSLGKDAIMIVPQKDEGKNYATIRKFLQNASNKKQIELWKKVAEEIKNLMAMYKGNIYLNTHGLGVPYLHIRLDTRGKYGYGFLNKN